MILSDFAGTLARLDLPITYKQFKKGESPDLPYLIYYVDEVHQVKADNQTYFENPSVIVELYTTSKNLELEGKTTDLFNQHKLDYDFLFETYLETDEMFMVSYAVNLL